MMISKLQGSAPAVTAAKQAGTQGASFKQAMSASQSSSSASSTSETTYSDSVTQNFMDYMKETPSQRMFESFLSSQKITKEQYAAMSPADQQKLIDEFKRQLEQKMAQKNGSNSTGSTVDIMV